MVQSLFVPGCEGTGDRMIDHGEKPQDPRIAGLSVGSQTPQELVACRITVGHLVLKFHQILGDELLGLPKDKVSFSGIHLRLIRKIPDGLLSGAFAVHEDEAQETHQETGLGESAGTAHPPTVGETHFVDGDIGMLRSINFL